MTFASNAPTAILMIRPKCFGYNTETAKTNFFQTANLSSSKDLNRKAVWEFDRCVSQLEKAGIELLVMEDSPEPQKPDAIFPNNWFSTHEDGTIVLYPLYHKNRRTEVRMDIIDLLDNPFKISRVIDLTQGINRSEFLEGTGSIVFDHAQKTAFACISPRTNAALFEFIAEELGYRPFSFDAVDLNGRQIYHTNVLMAITNELAIICAEAIENAIERKMILKELEKSKKVIPISFSQMNAFCGNVLALTNQHGSPMIAMSSTAFKVFTAKQKKDIQQFIEPLIFDIQTIENAGGGSIRCMMAGIHLPRA